MIAVVDEDPNNWWNSWGGKHREILVGCPQKVYT